MSDQTLQIRDGYIRFYAEHLPGTYTDEKPNYKAVDQLRRIASRWGTEGQHTYAGYVLFKAIDWAWGDGDVVQPCAEQAIFELQTAAELAGPDDLGRIAALRLLITVTGMNYTGAEPSEVRLLCGALYEDLGRALHQFGVNAKDPGERAAFLVRGFELETEFRGTWRMVVRGFEVDGSSMRYRGDYLSMNVPSAFTLFRYASDYQAAQTVATMCPGEFTSHGLRGWRAAVSGLLNSDEAVECFVEASTMFAQDTQEGGTFEQTGQWSSINVDLWAKHFAARAAIAEIVREPGRATELIRRAGIALGGIESGWSNPQDTCLRVLVSALNDILDSDAVTGVGQAKDALLQRARMSGLNDEESWALKFLDEVATAFALVRDAPVKAIVSRHLADALETLGRISLIGVNVAAAVEPRIGERALEHLLGPYRTWIYRTIEAIADERLLQRLLLRLMQAQTPRYAQILTARSNTGKTSPRWWRLITRSCYRCTRLRLGRHHAPLACG